MGDCSVGDAVFFLHPKLSWVLGTVTAVDGIASKRTATCIANDAKRGVVGESVDKISVPAGVVGLLGDAANESVDDLLGLTVLHDATLLRCLFLRYMEGDRIYTNIGSILVALNPFTFDIPWCQDDRMKRYLAQPAGRIDGTTSDLLPHTWSVAHETYYQLLGFGGGGGGAGSTDSVTGGPSQFSPQFILISGESGSGKTEASKIVVKYFAAVSGKNATDPAALARCQACGAKLQQCSPILESFGNARTVRNDNSSRFGKFMKIQFNEAGVLTGSQTTRYLLEKSRIVTAARNERVFHSFYLLHRGDSATKLGLRRETEYLSLTSGGMLNNGDFDTAQDFADVVAAMRTVGLTEDQIASSWLVPAGVISLLNVTFVPNTASGVGCSVVPAGVACLQQAASLWKVDAEALGRELVQMEITIKNQITLKQFGIHEAKDARDSLCKALYDALFGWLVERCNALCDAGADAFGWIGLLDIFGFEDFAVNSFEQLCINFANETLQEHYNAHVFKRDMDECRAEGIDTTNIPCPDNRACLELIASPTNGVFAMLDDACSMGDSTDAKFAAAVSERFSKHEFFGFSKVSAMHFCIRHYAGTVTYDAAAWLEKNKDSLRDSLRILMRGSDDPIVAGLLAPPNVDKRGKRPSVAAFFRTQLGELMAIINQANPHWIRCVKPHPAKKPLMFDGISVMNQLASSGVLGTVKIRKAGYPVRIPLPRFIDRFFVLHTDFGRKTPTQICGSGADSLKAASGVILRACAVAMPALAQLGKSKVFAKSEALSMIERARASRFASLFVRVQKAGRALAVRRATAALVFLRAAERIHSEWHSFLRRTAATRQERAERKARFDAWVAEATTTMLADHQSWVTERLSSINGELAWPFADAFTCVMDIEALRRAQIVREGHAAFWASFAATGCRLLELEEAQGRQRVMDDPQLLGDLFCAHTDFCEQRVVLLAKGERRERDAIEKEEERATFSRADPSALFNGFLRVQTGLESHRRNALLQQEEWMRNNSIIAPKFGGLRWLLECGQDDGCERGSRRALVVAEAAERDRWCRFEFTVAQRSRRASIEGNEQRARETTTEHEEPDAWETLMSHFTVVSRAEWLACRVSSLSMAERHARRCVFDVEQESRDFFVSEADASRLFLVCIELAGEETVVRQRIARTEGMLRHMVLHDVITPAVARIATAVGRDESRLRERMEALEAHARRTHLCFAAAQIRFLRRELFLRRLVFLLWHLQHACLRQRLLISLEECQRRDGLRAQMSAEYPLAVQRANTALQYRLQNSLQASLGDNSSATFESVQAAYYASPTRSDLYSSLWRAIQKN